MLISKDTTVHSAQSNPIDLSQEQKQSRLIEILTHWADNGCSDALRLLAQKISHLTEISALVAELADVVDTEVPA